MPLARLSSKAVTIKPNAITTAAFEARLRLLPLPIVARITEDKVLLDLRTIPDSQLDAAAAGVMKALE